MAGRGGEALGSAALAEAELDEVAVGGGGVAGGDCGGDVGVTAAVIGFVEEVGAGQERFGLGVDEAERCREVGGEEVGRGPAESFGPGAEAGSGCVAVGGPGMAGRGQAVEAGAGEAVDPAGVIVIAEDFGVEIASGVGTGAAEDADEAGLGGFDDLDVAFGVDEGLGRRVAGGLEGGD